MMKTVYIEMSALWVHTFDSFTRLYIVLELGQARVSCVPLTAHAQNEATIILAALYWAGPLGGA